MAENERISPRAAIRSWLHDKAAQPVHDRHTEKAKRSDRRDLRRRSHAPLGGDSRSPQASLHRRHDGSYVDDGLECKIEFPKINSLRTQPESEYLNSAERLGLHAPFRRIQDHVDNIESADSGALPRKPKRRHRKSSTDSYLELANIEKNKKHEQELQHVDLPANISTELLTDPVANVPPLEKRTVAYERRKRHKTRDDHYDLKEDGGTGRKRKLAENKASERKQKSRKRKEKSGAAILHAFAAQNVSQDRLTLQPSRALGFFGKGRASSPVRRRGVPDLAFSETTFLNSRRGGPEEVIKTSTDERQKKNKNRKSTKAADTEAEISRYFTQAQATVPNARDNRRQHVQHSSRNMTQAHDSPPEFVDLPKTPFLGFGSSGANSISPPKHLGSPGIGELERKLTQSPTRSSSYLTWSQSGAPSRSSHHACTDRVTPVESSTLPNRNAKSPASDPCRPSRPLQSSLPNQRTSAAEHRNVNRSVSKGESDSKSRSPINDAAHPKETQITGMNASNDYHQERPTDIDEKPAGEGASYKPISPAQNSGDLYPRDENAVPSNAGLVQGKVDVSQQATSTRPQAIIGSLDDTLEALLRDYRAQHTVCAAQSPLPQPVLANPNDQHLTGGIRDQLLKDPSRSSSYAHHAPTSSLRTQTRARRRAESADISSSRDLRDYRPHTQGSLHAVPRQKTVSPRRASRELTPSAPHISESSKNDSRSAWTGYDTICERQQSLQNPDRAEDEGYDYDHQCRNPYGCDMVRESQHESQIYDQEVSRPIGEIENIRGAAYTLDEEIRCSPWDEPFAQYRDSVVHEGWRDDDEGLLANYGGDDCMYRNIESDGADLRNHGIVEDLEPYLESDHMSAEALQIACGPEWRDSSNNIVARGFAANWINPMNGEVTTDDGALSRFWTPHKLY